MRRALLIIALAVSACASSGPQVRAENASSLPFIEDDYEKALQLAKEKKLPLFVDTWAPWCHSCVFLREHVLTRPELARNEKRFVFLALNTERPTATAFLEKYPVENWPTLFIIDSASGHVVLKWLGTATVTQLEGLFTDGEKAVAAVTGDDPAALLVKADGLYAEGKPSLAATAYGAAAQKSDATWERRPRTIESWLTALWAAKQYEDCVKTAKLEIPKLPRGPSFLNATVMGLSCASDADDAAAWKKDGVAALETLGKEALAFDGVLADDRSGLFESLIDARELVKDEAGAKALALQWLEFLEGEAKKAPNPAARAVFDAHRTSAALAAGVPARTVATLKQTEAEFPDDYNPPARLAMLYRELGQYDEAMAAIERGLSKAYGPRKLRLFEIKASVLEKKKDQAGQKATLAAAVAYGKELPAPQRPEKAIARLEASLKALP